MLMLQREMSDCQTPPVQIVDWQQALATYPQCSGAVKRNLDFASNHACVEVAFQ